MTQPNDTNHFLGVGNMVFDPDAALTLAERTAKIYIKDDKLNVELGKGICSSEWNENLEQLKAIFN